MMQNKIKNQFVPVRRQNERVYVKVSSDTDETGYVQPTSITWKDGRTFMIDKVRDFRPASAAGNPVNGDCFTVIIGGEERHLYYEKTESIYSGRYGRWFVERAVYVPIK